MKDRGVLVDTWGWAALGYPREPRHEEVKQLYRDLRASETPIYTTDYVLDELVTLLFRREPFEQAARFIEGVLGAAALGQVRIERITADRFSAAWKLRKRFQDKPRISFTDLASMVVMTERGIERVLTEDEHFIQVGLHFSRVP